MKTLLTMVLGTLALFATGVSLAQSVMDRGAWGVGWMGGLGGIWVPIVLVLAAAGLLVWVVRRERE